MREEGILSPTKRKLTLWLYDVVVHKVKVRMPYPMSDILLPPCEQVVEDVDVVAFLHQRVNKMTSNKASTTSNENSFLLRL